MLFVPKDTSNLQNDPFMINPKGIRVQVPEDKVEELLKKGFVLEDKDWTPTIKNPIAPGIFYALKEAKLKAETDEDLLPVTEV